MYGSTETQRAVGHFVVPDDETELKNLKEVIPCGRGMKDVDLLLLNNANILAGIGEIAEIYVRSHHLAKGYVSNDETSSQKFIPNPFTDIPGDRLYRTGDLGRYTTQGILECMGRADDQVKIRGFRIELGEINAVLSRHPQVKENVTIVRADGGEKRLVSYIVPIDNGECLLKLASNPFPLEKDIRTFLKSKLPSYMIPSRVVVLLSMPLTPNGKIDRAGLPAPLQNVAKAKSNLTTTQSKVLSVWSRILDCSSIGLNDDFFDLGGHSVLATRLTFEMEREFGIDFPVNLLFQAPTVELISVAIDNLIKGASAHNVSSINLDLEATLPDDIKVDPSLLPASTDPKNILLTGATGFLGAFLLREILDLKPGTRVYCHVRAANHEVGLSRLIENMTSHLLWKDEYRDRIVAVPGDLGQPLLGLTKAQYSELADIIDIIIHNGAMVHWILSYQKLKPVNVGGTIELLRLAVTSKLKTFQHISTTSVFDTNDLKSKEVVYDDDPLSSYEGLSGGYPRTKWVAEKLVLRARSRGLSTSIFRPGYVIGDSINGVWNADDFLCRLMKGCIQLGAFPKLNSTLDMSSVDYVSKSIIYIALNHSSSNRGYNIVNPNLYSYEKLFHSLKSVGYPIQELEYSDWRQKLVTAVSNGEDNALSSIISHFTPEWPSGLKNPIYDCSNTLTLLKETNITQPDLSALFPLFVSYLIQCGFLPVPKIPSPVLSTRLEKRKALRMLSRSGRHGSLKRKLPDTALENGHGVTKKPKLSQPVVST
eukprot:TRINITY_DN1967_c0_g1_i2.p1 TRINITY_DN1967_c0_g1~~TRINITY_DN1967_c0_g1_i2.p1  ORF type:complete len:765 (-),score=135.67 TRINITY_DN1967_c0_g1_i2:104-2398(-)